MYLWQYENDKKRRLFYVILYVGGKTADLNGRHLAVASEFSSTQERKNSREGETEREKREGYTGAVSRQISIRGKDQWAVRE